MFVKICFITNVTKLIKAIVIKRSEILCVVELNFLKIGILL